MIDDSYCDESNEDYKLKYIYSSQIKEFLKNCTQIFKNILNKEAAIKLRRTRFEFQGLLYPINLVVFEHPDKLGHYDSSNYQIGLNKILLYKAKPHVLKNILRHEIAHMFCHLIYGDKGLKQAHGPLFRSVCKKFNWNKDVSNAYINLNLANSNEVSSNDINNYLKRVEKLFNLASSSNPHEASLALQKANQLIAKYQLNFLTTSKTSNSIKHDIYMVKTLKSSKLNSKLKALYEIMKYFYVSPVLGYGKKQVWLEIIGKKANIEFALYVCDFLNLELDRLWKATKKENPKLHGLGAKNSFFEGLANGFCNKLKNAQSQTWDNFQDGQTHQKNNKDYSNSLSAFNLKTMNSILDLELKMVYPKLGSKKTSRSIDQNGLKAGFKAGKDLTLLKPIQDNGAKQYVLT